MSGVCARCRRPAELVAPAPNGGGWCRGCQLARVGLAGVVATEVRQMIAALDEQTARLERRAERARRSRRWAGFARWLGMKGAREP